MIDDKQQRDRDTLEMLTGGLMPGGMLDGAPKGAKAFIRALADILEGAASRPPHVCEEGCRCRRALRRALVQEMEKIEARERRN